MTMQTLRELLNAKPFRPFDVYLSDGRKIRAPHHDFVFLGPDDYTVIIYTTPKSFQLIDIDQVVSAEPMTPRRRKRGSGSKS